MAFHLKLMPLFTWSIGGYAVANLKDNAMEIRTPSTVDTQLLPNDAHCLTFYYNLGKYAALYVVIEQTMSGMRIWSSQPSDPQNKWLPGEATVFPTHDVARVCSIINSSVARKIYF